jgi:AraC-like DNA-binding protein
MAPQQIPKASLIRGMVPDELLQPLFSQSIAAYMDAQPVRRPEQSKRPPEIHQYHLGQAIFLDTTFEAQRFRRDPAWMARNDDVDHLALQMYLRGSNRVVNGAHEFTQKPGNVFAVNLAYEVYAESDDSEVLTLIMPRSVAAAALPRLLDAAGGVFTQDSASAQVFCDHMLSLRQNLASATTTEIGAIMQGTFGLLESLANHGDLMSSAAQQATLHTICAFIDRHLRDPELGVERLCRQFRCSRATLYRLFKPLGGVREHIQRRRLMACFRAIATQGHRRIFDIALDYGFISPSHFSNLFRDYFGMTPRDVRDAGQQSPQVMTRIDLVHVQDGRSPKDDAELMWQWGLTLAKAGGIQGD